MLARLLGFMLGNRGGLAPKIDLPTAQEPYKCCVLEGSHARGGTVVQFGL